MADTRKPKLQAMLDAMEASKARLTRQQLLDAALGRVKPEGAEEGVIEAEINQRLGKAVPSAGMMPKEIEVLKVESEPEDFKSKSKNLPYMGGEQKSVPLPETGGVKKVKKYSRLYQMMQ
jgi:hypothetical protein